MKRLTAILLSVLFLLTALPLGAVSVAADDDSLSLGVPSLVVTDADGYAYIYFTPATSGIYDFYSISGYDTYATLCNNWGGELVSDDDGGEDLNFNIRYQLYAGNTYTLRVRYYNYAADTNMLVCVDYAPLTSIPAGVNVDLVVEKDKSTYITFTPDQTGWYEFYSSSEHDAYAYILNAQGDTVKYDDDGGEGLNFYILCRLNAGETYTLDVRCYEDETVVVPVCMEKSSKSWMTLGEVTVAQTDGDGYAYVHFIPSETGIYEFCSVSDYDTYAVLFQEGSQMAYNDDGGEGLNFSIRYLLYSNQEYTLQIRYTNYAAYTNVLAYVDRVEADTLPVDVPTDVTLDGSPAYFCFEPQEPGVYEFYSVSDYDTVGHVYLDYGQHKDGDDDSGDGLNFRVRYFFDTGRAYFLEANAYGSEAVTASVCIRKPELAALPLGVTTDVECEGETYVTFTPSRTGMYEIYSLAESEEEYPYSEVTIYNEDGNSFGYSTYYEYGNFHAEKLMRAGTTYTIEMSGNTTVPVRVEQVEISTLPVGTPTEVEFVDTSYAELYFIPEETGKYTFYSISDEDTRAYIRDVEENQLYSDDDSGEGNNFLMEYTMSAGELYVIDVRVDSSYNCTLSVCVEKKEIPVLPLGVLTDVEVTTDHTDLLFIPEESGYYSFYSSSSSDTYGYIYDAEGNMLQYNDDSGENNNFRMSCYMTAGTTYILQVRFYSYSSGTIPVMIEKYNPMIITDIDFMDQSLLLYQIEGNYAPSMVVTYSNGHQTTYGSNWISDDMGEYYVESRIVGNPDTLIEGMTYTVNATVELSNRTITGSYQLTVLECPIASVSVQPITVVENTGGYWRTQSYWIDGEYYEWTYYHYENIYPDWSTTRITLKDGTVIEGTDVFFDNDWYSIYVDNQTYDHQLTLGANQWRLSILGYETTYTINVIESPFASAGGTTVECLQYESGYWREKYNWDPETQTGYYDYYYVYNTLPDELVLNMRDGTQQRVPVVDNPNDWYGGKGIVYNGQWYEIEFNNEQTYENQWQVGTYIANATVMGVNVSYYYVIQRRPNDLLLEYQETSEGLIITGCVYPLEELEIPATLFGKPVIGMVNLGDGGSIGVRRLVLPDSVRYIGEYLLSYTNVESVHFGAGVENLAMEQFFGTYNLKEITVSPYNPYYTAVDNVLYDKDVATLIAYPEDRDAEEYIVPMTLYDALPLTECNYRVNVVIPEDHPYMATIDGVTYDKGMTRVLYCNEEVDGEYEMPDSVTEMADYAFAYTALTRVVVAPKVTEIAYHAFASCAMLEEISLPEGLVSIVDRGLAYTGALESVVLPSTVTYLDNMALMSSGIRSITLPVGLEFIGNSAFSMCYNLTDVYYTGSEADREAMYIGYNNDLLLNATWHYNACPKGGEHSYNNACDASCNACGYVREDIAGHEYSSPCTASCVNCGATRTPPHGYADACDDTCDLCGTTRVPPHEFDNGYDTECNNGCGFTREVPDVAPGDTNGDGKINVRDLGLMQQFINGWDVKLDLATADVNGDGKINVRDLGLVQQYINGWDVQLGG